MTTNTAITERPIRVGTIRPSFVSAISIGSVLILILRQMEMEHLDTGDCTRDETPRVENQVTIREILRYYRDVWNEWKYFVGMDLPIIRNYKLGRLWEEMRSSILDSFEKVGSISL